MIAMPILAPAAARFLLAFGFVLALALPLAHLLLG
jgi:hypothetical protein